MRKRLSVMRQLLVMSLMAMGLFGVTAMTASAAPVCDPQTPGSTEYRALQFADENGDGIASTAEMRALGDDELTALADQLESEGYDGIQYTGCTPTDDAADDTADTADDTADTADDTADTADDTADATDDTADTADDTADATDDTADATDDTADTADDTADATDDSADATDDTADGSADTGDDSADGTADGSGDGTADGSGDVTELPETGVGAASTQDHTAAYIVGTSSVILLAGAYLFRLSRKA